VDNTRIHKSRGKMTTEKELMMIHDLMEIIIEHATGRKWPDVSWRVDGKNRRIIICYDEVIDLEEQ